MSNLSELLPTGGGQNAVDFVATGTLASGVTVALKTDGTVEAVATTSVPVSIPTTASPITFNASSATFMVSQFHPTNANIFVIAYRDAGNGSYGTAIVGTVSGNSITFSSPSVFESAQVFNISIAFDASNPSNFVIAYTDQGNSNRGTAVIGTISGTSLSYGTPVAFTTGAATDNIGVDFVSSNKFVVAYQDGGNSNYGTAIVGTVSGSSISYGSASVFESASTFGCALKGDPNAADVFVVAYLDNGNSNYGTAIVGTVSGSSISYGSATVFKAAAIGSTENGISFDPNTANKFVIMFVSSSVFTAIIGTRSGTSLSFGSGAAIQNNSVTNPSISYNPNTANEFLIAYRNNGNSNYGTATVCTVSSSTITVGTSYVYNAYLSNYNALTFDPSTSGKFAVSFYNANGTIGSTILGQLAGTGTNNTSFIGITSEAISDTATGAVNVYGGINEAQSGLTIGSDYYVQADGSLSTTTSTVKVGQAISATTINMKDLKL